MKILRGCFILMMTMLLAVMIQGFALASDGSGRLQPGWNCSAYGRPDGGTVWYYGDQNGDPLTGWQLIGEKWYYFAVDGYEAGRMYAEEWLEAENAAGRNESDRYYLTASGAMAVGWQRVDVPLPNHETGYEWYYFGSDGKCRTGWQLIDGKWYYFEENGEHPGRMYADEWMIGDQSAPNGFSLDRYYLTSSGAMASGWQKLTHYLPGNETEDQWYFFGYDGRCRIGWHFIDGKWYYFERDDDDPGRMYADQWLSPGEYYLTASGAMATGWQRITTRLPQGRSETDWFYFDAEGRYKTGWQMVHGVWYYFDPSGAMAANEWVDGYWLGHSGAWTYQPYGSWKQDAQGRWFGDTSGWYARNTTVKIDGVEYVFNSDGYWIK